MKRNLKNDIRLVVSKSLHIGSVLGQVVTNTNIYLFGCFLFSIVSQQTITLYLCSAIILD